MRRRRFLAAAVASALPALSGCTALAPDRPPASVRDVPRIGPRTDLDTAPTGSEVGQYTVGPAFVLAVGEHRPHAVYVSNVADERVAFDLEVVRWNGRTVLDVDGGLPPETHLAVTLRGPANYSLVLAAGGVRERLDVEESWFDCNDSHHNVVVDGEDIDYVDISTTLGCGFAWP